MRKKLTAGLVAGIMILTSLGAMNVSAAKLNFVTGGPMGTYYAVGGAMTTVLNPVLGDNKLVIESSGASMANLEMLEEGDAQLATVQNDVMYYAFTGTNLFEEDDPYSNFSVVAGLYDETVQIVTCDESIASVADLAGKKVSVGDEGSGTEYNAKQILEAYGLSFDDIEKVNASFGDSADSLINGSLDAAFVVAGAPTVAVEELAESKKIKLIPIDEEHIATLQEAYDFYTSSVIPAETYKGQEEDVVSVSVVATLVASNEVEEAVIYDLTKALFENKDALAGANAKFANLSAEEAVKGMGVPFHAGAKKYYEEQGITVE